jgi:hypothetical protein
MSWFIEKTRNTLGFTPTTTPEEKTTISPEDSERFIVTQRARVGQLTRRLEKIKAEIPLEKTRKLLELKLRERDRIQLEISNIQASLSNLEGAKLTESSADAVIQSALILKNTNAKIGKSVEQTEKLDVDKIVDDYRGNAQTTTNLSSRLAQPWLDTGEDEDKIDAELDALLLNKKEEDEELDFYLPQAPTHRPKVVNNNNNNNVTTTQEKEK